MDRCVAAHQNGNEAFSLFSIAVLAAAYRGVNHTTLSQFSLIFLLLRLIYNALYISQPSKAISGMRSLVWAAGVGICVYFFVLAAKGGA